MSEAPGTNLDGVLVDRVADWLMSQALGEARIEDIFVGCCNRLHAAGVPLWRAMVAFRTLHPVYASTSLVWTRGGGADSEHHLHDEAFNSEQWRRSPMAHMLTNRLPFLRRRLAGEQALVDFPVLDELAERGATDYVGYTVAFGGDEPDGVVDGIAGSWATDRTRGFTDEDLRVLGRIQSRLAVSFKVQIKDQTTRNILDAYLGRGAGDRVLAGQIRRGDGEHINAAIWYSDMRDSTRLADELSGEDFLATVNDYFECTAGAVLAHGGEVLRFIGDAVLAAIFPIDPAAPGSAAAACAAAIAAAADAEARLDALNASRAGDGLAAVDFGLGLHVGEVMFGNIGVAERVEFSVVGPAANEVARIENLTKELGRRVLLSGAFADTVGMRCDSLGTQRLRGVAVPVEVFAPCAPGVAAPAS